MRRLLTLLRGSFARRTRETMRALAHNREAEAGLWGRVAQMSPNGSDKEDEAIRKQRDREQEARRLRRNLSFERGMNIRSEAGGSGDARGR